MSIDLTTPALLFSTISLLLLAYTNRFLGLANIIRKLHADHSTEPNQIYVEEIRNLRRRIYLIRDMQTLGVFSLLLCTICMSTLFLGWIEVSKWIFGSSLVLMAASLGLSIVEIRMSVGALEVHLRDMEHEVD
jgi:hypothetical protein